MALYHEKRISGNATLLPGFLLFVVLGSLGVSSRTASAGPLYGPAPSGAVDAGTLPNGGSPLPQAPNGAVPSYNGPGFGAPLPGSPAGSPGQAGQPGGAAPQGGTGSPAPASGPTSGTPGSGGTAASGGSSQAPSDAPTFMDSSMPNSANPFLPSVVSPGSLSGPLENAYLQNGVPQLAAPLMSAVYRPFGLTFFQPNPSQVIPQGSVSVTGSIEHDTNIDFSPNQPQPGELYSITPAVMYSNFDDYGYIQLLANASYYGYDTGNVPAYLDETAGISAGTYLGTRLFVGAQDLYTNGSTPQLTGQPMAFFNGINSYWDNLADAEVGIALTPLVTFVQSASDMYFDDANYGAGIMNLQTLMDTLNYQDKTDFLSASYLYQQGIFSLFPGFDSNGVMGTAMRSLTPQTSIGVGGSLYYYFYQNQPLLNFMMYSYYGILTHHFTRTLFMSAMGGWNATVFQNGQSFPGPLWDVNLGYNGPRLTLGLNGGQFVQNYNSYGIELGPESTTTALGYLTYILGAKTSFYASAGYTYYSFQAAQNFSNNFFPGIQPTFFSPQANAASASYNGTYINQTDELFYKPYPWLMTSLTYNLIEFTTNLPNSTVMDNQFIAMVTFFWNFH